MESCFKCECLRPFLRCASSVLTLGEIAVIYLGVAAIAGAVFVFCSFWVYHYVDLEHEVDDTTGTESEMQ